MDEYDEIAEWYAANRNSAIGVADVEKLAQSLDAGAKILDLGCGTGYPISRWLLQNGFEVFGLDSSKQMIERYRRHFPAVRTQCARIEVSDFFHTSFAAVVSWGVFFHLPAEHQELGISKVAKALIPGGKFLFTSGEEEGIREGSMNGVRFTYTSLGSVKYRALLEKNGLDLLEAYSDAWENYIYIAKKRTTSSYGEPVAMSISLPIDFKLPPK